MQSQQEADLPRMLCQVELLWPVTVGHAVPPLLSLLVLHIW